MRSTTTLAASLLIVLAFTGTSTASLAPSMTMDPTTVSPGPFAGAVLPGETNSHHYQNAPSGAICVALAQPYTVFVESSGPVLVSVGTHSTVVDGTGSMTFWRGVCTAFDITVANGGELPVAYAIEVLGGPAGGGGLKAAFA